MTLNKPFVSLLTDFGFKKFFADPTDTSFLQKVLQIIIQPDVPIQDVRIDNTHQIKEEDEDRGAVYDVFCSDKRACKYILEMQRTEVKNFINRVQFYTYFRLNEMVEKGGKMKYHKLRPIYSISFLDGNAYPGEEFFHTAHLRDQHGETINDLITHIIIELNKWNKTEDEIETDLDKLILLMKFTDTATAQDPIPEVLTKEEWTAQTLEKLKTNNLTKAERVAYKDALAKRASLDEINRLAAERDRLSAEREEKAKQTMIEAQQIKKQAKEIEKQAKVDVKQAKEDVKQAQQETKQIQQKLSAAIIGFLQKGASTDEEIAELFNVEIEYIQQLKEKSES